MKLTLGLGTELQNLSVAQTVISAANSMEHILAWNYASQALNNSFFFDNLVGPLDLFITINVLILTSCRLKDLRHLAPHLPPSHTSTRSLHVSGTS